MIDQKKISLFTSWAVIAGGLGMCAISIWNFPVARLDSHLIAVVLATFFFGAFLHIQLPRTKIHVTSSDALIFFVLLTYGSEIAVLLAFLESVNVSLSLKLKKVKISPRTLLTSSSINTISAYFAGQVLKAFLHGRPLESILDETQSLLILLSVLVFAQFLCTSILISYFTAVKHDKSFWKVWNESCLSAFIVYITGAIIAGLLYKAIQTIDLFLILVAASIAIVVYLTYKRYVEDIQHTAAKAEQAERMRAEQAEKHVTELEHYVSELERTGLALREREEQFRHAAFHDALTDLPNRVLCLNQLNRLLRKHKRRNQRQFAVLFLDLNRFKNINDSLGHSVGDALLISVARRLQSVVRQSDIVARFGGDEFAVILKDIDNLAQATEFAKRIEQKMAAPFILSGRRIFSSTSVGIAMSDGGYDNAEDILRDADIAMYYAKEHGDGFAVFDQDMHTRVVSLMQTESDLRYALERREFCLHYQPIIALDTTELAGFEALIRWNHPTRGLLSPAEFIPLSESTGLIIPMTLWVLREVCEQIKAWQKISRSDNLLAISVNISGKHFAESDLVGQIEQILVETAVNPHCLKLEITESAVMENAENAIAMLKQLKNLGLQLSIDDFGTGYSSLSYLHRFPTDTLKVDRSFVGAMEEGSENSEIVRTIVALAKTLNLDVVAEGIETVQQLQQLRILGCEYGQGYLFSRPLPKLAAESLLREQPDWKNLLLLTADYAETAFPTSAPHILYAELAA